MTLRKPTIYDCGIYCIISPSGKKYIGSSNNIPKRWSQHKRELRKGTHHSPHLQNSYNKYQGNFEFQVLLVCREEDLQLYEQQYLDFYNPEYNISPTAYSCRGIKRTDKFKKRVSEFQTGNKWNVGKKQSPEHIEAVRQTLFGNKRASGPHKTPRSDEHKNKLRLAGMGHSVSEERRRKIGEASKAMWARKKAEKLNVSV